MTPADRVAVVTGGSGALGRAVVARLLTEGASVWVPWIDEREVEPLRDHLGGTHERLRLHRADVCDEEAVAAFFARVDEGGGRLDTLCNIVGGFLFASLGETSLAEWRRMQEMNATSAFLCSREAAPRLRESGGGSIVSVTAMPALERGAARMSAYASAKAAVLSLTHSLAAELAADGITVNAVAPSIIDTPANRRAMPDADTAGWLLAEEIAAVIAFLAGPEARIVTGAALTLAKGTADSST